MLSPTPLNVMIWLHSATKKPSGPWMLVTNSYNLDLEPFSLRPPLRLAKVSCLAGDEQAHDKAEETQDGAKDLNDQNLDEAMI